MSFLKLNSDTIRKHKGKSFTGVSTVFFCHDGLGNILMAKRSENARDEQGMWEPGGGGLKFGVSAEDNVRREVHEEYGVEAKKIQFIGYWDAFRELEGVPTHWIVLGFVVLIDRKLAIINETDMIDEIDWFTLESLPTPLHSQMGVFLAKLGPELRNLLSSTHGAGHQ